MDGWLAYHAAFVACVAAALYRCGTDPVRLAADRATLTLMCRAITGAFAALRTDGTAGLPRNLAVLHSPLLRAVAVRYWARTMRSPTGELCFAAHSRHAEAEMRSLGQDVAARITNSPALTELLRPLTTSYDAPTVALQRAVHISDGLSIGARSRTTQTPTRPAAAGPAPTGTAHRR